MTYKDLFARITETLTDRRAWEERQRLWYMMRHEGLRRRRKPFPEAADMHYPLIDQSIEKTKPFFWAQLRAGQRVTSFVSKKTQQQEETDSAADFFDYLMINETNYRISLGSVIDTMLMRGRGVVKLLVDWQYNELSFESVDPLYLIVPRGTLELEDADWICHVIHKSVDTYKRDRRYNQEEDLIKRITGPPSQDPTGDYEDEKAVREGLTHSSDKQTIVLWEVYWRTTGGWTVYTFSPSVPERPLRKPFGLRYKDAKGRAILPFVSFPTEIKDPGWYSPRGFPERMADFEASCNRTWSEHMDWQSFSNKPLFTGPNHARNTANIRFAPGEILPEGLAPIQFPPPPFTFDQELVKTARIAEERLALADANIGPTDSAKRDNPTATEVSYRRALSQVSVDMKSTLFRIYLGQLFKKAWSMIVTDSIGDPHYVIAAERKVLPDQARHDNYFILPQGESDDWNKPQRMSRAHLLFQTLNGHPNIDQAKLARNLLASDHTELVQELWMPGMGNIQNEIEEEATEMLLLRDGFPAFIGANENHQIRIKVITDWMLERERRGEPVDEEVKVKVHQHLAQHIQYLQAQNPNAAGELRRRLNNIDQSGPQQPNNGTPYGTRTNQSVTGPA